MSSLFTWNGNLIRTFHSTSPCFKKISKSKEPSLISKGLDGVERPRSTSIFKKMQNERWRVQNASTNSIASNSGFKTPWDYKMSVIITRMVVVAPPLEPWEIEYNQWKDKWLEPIQSQLPKIQTLVDEDLNQRSNQDFDDEARIQNKQNSFQNLQDILTADTQSNDTNQQYQSLRRKLNEKLYLIVKKNRSQHEWRFPQFRMPLDKNDHDLPLRSIAESGALRQIGSNIKIYMTGNAPVGFHSYPFPTEIQQEKDTYGVKLFFYRGYYVCGNIQLNPRYIDHAWVTKEELKDHLKDPVFYHYLSQILI